MVEMFERKREELIKRLIQWGYLNKPEVVKAFRNVPRHEFVPENLREGSYTDQPLPIGHGQTISAPSMIAIMIDSLDLAPGQNVLEIGAGSGYNAALVAEIVGRSGKVITIERIAELAEFAGTNLRKTGYDWVQVITGDGTCGHEGGASWDRILVTACAPELPKPLTAQLKIGGKLGAPIGRHYMSQTWIIADKRGENKLEIQERGGCSFVPLVGKHGWKSED